MGFADELLSDAGDWAYLVVFIIIFAEAIPFVGPFIPAQLFLLGAGFVAKLGLIGAVRVWLVAIVALYLADMVSFQIGRKYGDAFLTRLPGAIRRRTHEIRAGLTIHLRKSLIIAQFLGPARALTPPLAGSAHVHWPKFLVWNAVGVFLWVTFCIVAGWFFGASYLALQRELGRDALILLLVILVAYLGVQRFRVAKKEDELLGEE